MNKEHETLATSSAGGVHKQGSARAFFQDAEPTTQVNGDAFDSGDLGLFWFDSNASPDNQFNVLTATTPTWTPISTEIIAVLLASNRQFAGTLTVDGAVTNSSTTEMTGDVTVNTNKVTITAASGNIATAGTFDPAGNIDPTTYETTNGGFLDEDAMGSDAADKVASQQSIKAYVNNKFVYAKVYNSATQSATGSGSEETVEYDTEEFDSTGSIVTLANERLTPGVVGYYHVGVTLRIVDLGTDDILVVRIKKNGTAIAMASTMSSNTGGDVTANPSTIVYMDADDYVTATVTHTDSARNLGTGTDDNHFYIARIGG